MIYSAIPKVVAFFLLKNATFPKDVASAPQLLEIWVSRKVWVGPY